MGFCGLSSRVCDFYFHFKRGLVLGWHAYHFIIGALMHDDCLFNIRPAQARFAASALRCIDTLPLSSMTWNCWPSNSTQSVYKAPSILLICSSEMFTPSSSSCFTVVLFIRYSFGRREDEELSFTIGSASRISFKLFVSPAKTELRKLKKLKFRGWSGSVGLSAGNDLPRVYDRNHYWTKQT